MTQPPTILISITTTDKNGNFIQNSEKRIFHDAKQNPDIKHYCEIFFNALSKQEFSKDDIATGIKNFFIQTDKKDLSQ